MNRIAVVEGECSARTMIDYNAASVAQSGIARIVLVGLGFGTLHVTCTCYVQPQTTVTYGTLRKAYGGGGMMLHCTGPG